MAVALASLWGAFMVFLIGITAFPPVGSGGFGGGHGLTSDSYWNSSSYQQGEDYYRYFGLKNSAPWSVRITRIDVPSVPWFDPEPMQIRIGSPYHGDKDRTALFRPFTLKEREMVAVYIVGRFRCPAVVERYQEGSWGYTSFETVKVSFRSLSILPGITTIRLEDPLAARFPTSKDCPASSVRAG